MKFNLNHNPANKTLAIPRAALQLSGLADVSDLLLGATLTALAAGGSTAMSFETAVQLGAVYLAGGLVIALAVMHFREITY